MPLKTLFLNPPSFENFDGGAGSRWPATREIERVVKSAVANATQKNENLDVDNLFVQTCFINEGPRQKRIRPAPMGRAYRYQRRTSHITIELGER